MTTNSNKHYKFDRSSYYASCTQYELLADEKLDQSTSIIISGYDASMKVRGGSLVLTFKKAHKQAENEIITLDRAVHGISTIILICDGGFITIDALEWCIQQNITVYLMKWTGELLQVLTPKQSSQAKLVYKQYLASQSDRGFIISIEIIRQKTYSQIETLASCHFLNDAPKSLQLLRQGIDDLDTVSKVESLLGFEGSMANIYFNAFVGYPIQFDKRAVNAVPVHWKSISTRKNTLLLPVGVGRSAINPFHATLNYAYALLGAQILQEIISRGFDPTIAFLHSYNKDRNSLVYDLMEPFRPMVDKMVFSFFQSTVFKRGDFYQTLDGSCRLNEQLRRFVVASFRIEQKHLAQKVQWLKNMVLL